MQPKVRGIWIDWLSNIYIVFTFRSISSPLLLLLPSTFLAVKPSSLPQVSVNQGNCQGISDWTLFSIHRVDGSSSIVFVSRVISSSLVLLSYWVCTSQGLNSQLLCLQVHKSMLSATDPELRIWSLKPRVFLFAAAVRFDHLQCSLSFLLVPCWQEELSFTNIWGRLESTMAKTMWWQREHLSECK